MILFAKILLVCAVTALTVLAARYSVHMMQLEGYFLSQYVPHLFARLRRPRYLLAPPTVKKPLHYTPRILRLLVCLAILTALFAVFFTFGLPALCPSLPFPPAVFCVLLVPLASLWVLCAAAIMLPVEKAIARVFVRDAARRLKERSDLQIVAITGSYGKTSTKFILSTLLSERFSCLTPPSSYNTTLGVVRVIRERLQPDDEVFICEMGSRHIGDIRELCDLVRPTRAILTSIGPQHLDTFGSIEGVKQGKYELIEALGTTGTAVFSSLNEDVRALYEKAPCRKISAGFLPEDDVRAENLSVGCSGSAFTLVTREGERVECVTRLLGEHNISNILVAAAMALDMGLTPEEVSRGIAKIQPIEHRLQIVKQTPITVIDDAFNASPNGAKAALNVLARFTGRRVIVTPGFVELGSEQARFHRELGEEIAACADVAVLVGKKRAAEIQAGMTDFKGETHIVESLEEAMTLLKDISVTGDVVLFENDLPDNYE
ncbi:MAG: UDP-N-acetylmuramoyl-tripeptide--D-alanyl-D-alanine ligase [Clostridia bacterium]|nr:UDP-N-acetylmuramoyl-tripeptide--D-alanyl-D-alanine ligase [Clostridia bacterium]